MFHAPGHGVAGAAASPMYDAESGVFGVAMPAAAAAAAASPLCCWAAPTAAPRRHVRDRMAWRSWCERARGTASCMHM